MCGLYWCCRRKQSEQDLLAPASEPPNMNPIYRGTTLLLGPTSLRLQDVTRPSGEMDTSSSPWSAPRSTHRTCATASLCFAFPTLLLSVGAACTSMPGIHAAASTCILASKFKCLSRNNHIGDQVRGKPWMDMHVHGMQIIEDKVTAYRQAGGSLLVAKCKACLTLAKYCSSSSIAPCQP